MEKGHKLIIILFSLIIIILLLLLIVYNFFLITNDEGFKIIQLTDDDIDQKPIAFSPDGNKILYIQGAVDLIYNANSTEIWIMDADGSNREYVTECYWYPYDLQFSPDGTKIVYGDGSENIHSLYDIYLFDLINNTKTKLTNSSSYSGQPVFTPDGKKIVYINSGIWIMNIDGSNRTKILEYGVYPSISPDGKKISYIHKNDIFIMEYNGSNLFQLTNNSNEKSRQKFTPKGDYITFHSNGIWIINITTLQIDEFKHEEHNLSQFSINSGQSVIVFISQHEEGLNKPIDLYITDFDRTRLNRLTHGGTNWSPVFSHDSTEIIFRHRDNLGDDFEICVITNSNGKWGL